MVFEIYAFDNRVINYELYEYFKNELKNILKNIPNEIIEIIVKKVDLNYQWLEIICKTYLQNLIVAFIFSDHYEDRYDNYLNPSLVLLYNNKKNIKNKNKIYFNEIDIIYNLNTDSINIPLNNISLLNNLCINNLNPEEIKNIIFENKINKYNSDIDQYNRRKYYEAFQDEVLKSKKWRGYIDIDELWSTENDFVANMYIVKDDHFKEILKLQKITNYKNILKEINFSNYNMFKFKDLIKEIT